MNNVTPHAVSPSVTVKDIIKDVISQRRPFIMANIVAILATCVAVPIPLMMPLLVDEILLDQPGFLVGQLSPLYAEAPAVFYVVAVLISVLILRGCFFIAHIIQYKIFTRISKEIIFRMRRNLLKHLGNASVAEFETLGSGNVNAHLINDLDTVDAFIGVSAGRFLVSLLSLIGIAIVLLTIHWGLALFIFVLNPIVIFISKSLAKKVSELKKNENKSIEVFQETLSEVVNLFHHVRVNNRMDRFIDNTVEKAQDIRDKAIAFGYRSEAANRFSFTVYLLGFEIFRGAAILMVAYSDLSIGLMLAVFGYLWFMMSPIEEILGIQYNYHNAKAALERINNIFALEQEPDYPALHNPFAKNPAVAIRVENLSFSYTQDKPILKTISLNIESKCKVALVGASGGGKTTLAQLLVGLYPVQEGMIYYDGVPLREIGMERVRHNVFLVLQQPQLFNDTVFSNLTMGDELSEEQVYEALEKAQLREFIDQQEKGLQTMVGKNGIRLSGGQRQRLSIARMILANPGTVIFDESTSALDMQTEERLYETLEPFLEDKTVLIIAHRPSTIKKADHIFVLENGEIREQGKWDTLIKNGGFLAQKMQEV